MEPRSDTRSLLVNTIVCDLDGTLVDSIPGIGAALSAAFLSVGREMPVVDLRAAIGPPISIIARRLEPSLSDTEVAQIEQHYRTGYDTHGWRETALFQGVAETLQAFRQQGCRLYIVTNKPRVPTEKILDHLGLQNLFEEAVSRDSRSPRYESKTEMLRDLLHRRRLPASTTLMIGDTAEDGEAATANLLPFAFATYGYGAGATATLSAALSVDSFADLQQFLVVNPHPARSEKASA